jgi:hypothetical protein
MKAHTSNKSATWAIFIRHQLLFQKIMIYNIQPRAFPLETPAEPGRKEGLSRDVPVSFQ